MHKHSRNTENYLFSLACGGRLALQQRRIWQIRVRKSSVGFTYDIMLTY